MSKHHIRKHQLRVKGWSEEEITHAESVLERAEAKKHPAVVLLDQFVFWLLLLVVILGIGVFAVVIIPLIAVLDTWSLYLVLVLMGISLGTLFTMVVQDIHWLGRLHHGFALLLLPASVVIVFFLILTYAASRVHFSHDMRIVALVFAISLLAPYIYHLLTEHKRRG